MSGFKQLTEDFANNRVPGEQTVSGIRIALIIIGFAITLPLFLAGSRIGLSLGLYQASCSFIIGGIILTSIGCLTAIVGARSRVSTYMIIQFPFGRTGAKFVNLVLAITLFGWYGVTAYLFGQAVQNAVVEIFNLQTGITIFVVIGSLLMIATTVFGFKALDKLALFAVPLLIIFLISVVYFSLQTSSWSVITGRQADEYTVGVAISMVVGSYIVGTTLIPDLCRYARDIKHSIIAIMISLGLAFPLIFVVAAIPSLATGESDLVLIMMQLGMGLPALAMIVFATWTSNANNLYSTSLVLTTIFTGTPKWMLTIIAGLLCTVLAAMGIMEYFIPFLLFLGITIPPIAGIYIADFFFIRDGNYDVDSLESHAAVGYTAFVIWILASLFGYATAEGMFHLTRIPSCDAMLVAFGLYFFAARSASKKEVSNRLPKQTIT